MARLKNDFDLMNADAGVLIEGPFWNSFAPLGWKILNCLWHSFVRRRDGVYEAGNEKACISDNAVHR